MDFFKAHHVKLQHLDFQGSYSDLSYAQSMSRAKSDEAEENWPDPSRHLNELQHLRQPVQVPLKHSSTSSRTESDTRRRPKPTDASHKKSHSFFSTSPYLISSPQPFSESEASDSPFFPERTASTKRRARSSSSAGYSPTPSTSSSRAPSAEGPSKPFSFDKNKSWLQEASGSETGSMSPNIDRKSSKRSSKDPRHKQEDKENRDPTRASAPKKIGSSSSTDLLDALKGDIFKLTEMTTVRSDTTKQTSLARNTSHSRQLKQPFKPSERTKTAARHLRASIERRYAVIADIVNDGQVYNPLDVMKHRPLRQEDREIFESFHDDRYISLLDPWYISTDEIVSDMQWRKAQLDIASKAAEQIQSEQDLNMDKEQQPNIPTSSGLTDHLQGDTLMSFKEAVKAGPSGLAFAQRKGINSVSPSLSPASTPPQSPNLNNYTDPAFESMAKEEDEGKEFIEKRKSWSKPFFKKDKGKLKMKPDADVEVKKRYRNDEYLRFTQMSPSKDRELSPQLSSHSDSTFNDRPVHFGQTLLVPIDRHVSNPRGHRRSVSTMDVLPVPTPQPLGTPEPFPSADVSEAELSSTDSKKRPRLSSRRHSFDSLRASSRNSHRHFGLWHDKHHRKHGPIHSETDPLDDSYSRGHRFPFARSAHNSEYESDSNESDSKGHTRSRKGLGIRHFLKKETELTTKSPRVSPSSQEEEERRREHPPASVSPQPSLATRVALQEQRLREMANYSSDQEDSLDLQSASDFESSGIPNQPRSEESEQGSPTIPQVQDEEERHIVKLTLPYNDIPPEVQNMIQQYKAMDKAEITNAKQKKRDDEESSIDVADSIHTTDAASEADVTTASEADTEDNSTDKNDDNKSDDENTMFNSKTEDKIVIVEASDKDDIEFIKLLNVNLNIPNTNGMLVDLHVSMLGDPDQDYGSFEPILVESMQHVETELQKAKSLSREAKAFYLEHRQAIQELVLDDNIDHGERSNPSPSSSVGSGGLLLPMKSEGEKLLLKGTELGSVYSSPTSSPSRSRASSIGSIGHDLQRAPSLLLNNVPYRTVSPFDYRQEEVRLGINALRSEMDSFQQTLYETENLIKGIQTDMNNTSDRMPTILHDIPEDDYSSLKILEVEVESILANRAKSPWLDMGYAWLSYVLAFIAFLVWVIIRIIKWIRAVVIFPRTLWTTYTEYLVERDKAVKRASLQTVTSGLDKVPFSNDKNHRSHRHRHLRQRSSGADLGPRPSYTM